MNSSPCYHPFRSFSPLPLLIAALASLLLPSCKLDVIKGEIAELSDEEEFLRTKIQTLGDEQQLHLHELRSTQRDDQARSALEKELASLEQQLSTLNTSIASENKRIEACESYLKRYTP